MSSERSIVCYFGFNFYCQTSKWLLDFHVTVFQTQMVAERKLIFPFYCRAPFQFNDYPSDSRCDTKKVAVYDVPHASSTNDNWVYPCCGLFKLEKWEVHYHSCADIIQPYR